MTNLSACLKAVCRPSKRSPCFFALMLTLCLDVYAASEQARRWRPSADEQASVEVSNPRRNNPITPSENRRGKQLADEADELTRARQYGQGQRKPRGLEALETVQPLYVEHHNDGKNADQQSRKADVVYYDYARNKAIKVTVDLNNNEVEDTVVTAGVSNQPYITRPEINAALQLIFNHPQIGTNLRKAYQDVTGGLLTDVNQLDAQGGIYFPDKHSNLGKLAANCANERCVQLFIPIDDSHFLDATNIVVNLSSGDVLWVKEGISGHSH